MKTRNLNWPTRFARTRPRQPVRALLLAVALLLGTSPEDLWAYQQDSQAPQSDNSQTRPAPPYTQQTPDELDQLVAPIALYPDSLVAQILAASTFPAEIVEADRWLQANPDLKGDALAQAVDQQPWDPSVKALTAFPSVLANMDKNLSWTSSLGDAYYNQQADVMDAVQAMRRRAQTAGNLETTPQQTVSTQGSTIIIQPASPEIVYVPAYDPWLVYGGPIVAWPGWYPYPGIWFGGPYLSWGIGFPIGFYAGYGWGWSRWGSNWNNHVIVYNNNRYYSQSRTFYNRNTYYKYGGVTHADNGYNGNRSGNLSGVTHAPGQEGAANRNLSGATRAPDNVFNNPGAKNQPFSTPEAARGYAPPEGQRNMGTDAWSNFGHGGQSRSYSERGTSSFGGFSGGRSYGGGGFGGGGGSRGGGGGRR